VYTTNQNDTSGYQNNKIQLVLPQNQGKSREPEKAHNNYHKKGGTPTKKKKKREKIIALNTHTPRLNNLDKKP
jgi:hypothetical protein